MKISGKNVPPWKRTCLPLPFCASRAALRGRGRGDHGARRLSARVAGPPSAPTPARRSAARRPRRRPPVRPRRDPAPPCSPIAAAVPGSSTSRPTAAAKASASSGATATPAPDAARIRGTSVPGSMAATIGSAGGEDRVGLRRHADASRARGAAARRGRRPSPAARPAVRRARSRRSGRWRGPAAPALQVEASRAAAVDQHRHVGPAPGDLDEEVERLRVPDVAGVEHAPARRRCRARRGRRVIRSAGTMRSVSTKLGIVRTLPAPRRHLGGDVGLEVADSTVTASARR